MKISYIFDEGSSKEDTYLIGKNVFGVFDGANSVKRFFDKSGRSDGLIAAEIARDEFSKNNKTLKEHALAANKNILMSMKMESMDVSDKLNLWSTTAAVVRIKQKTFEWLQVSDSLILVIYKNGKFKLMVDDYNHDKKAMAVWKKLAMKKTKNIKNIIWEKTPHTRLRANKTFGLLTGEKEFVKFIHSGTESLENVKHIIIFTDGLLIPKKDPSEPDDFDTFVKLYLGGGLKKVLKHVRDLERNDPECWKYPRYNQYDDVAAISIDFS